MSDRCQPLLEKKTNYAIGLDVNINSLGHAGVELDANDLPCASKKIGAYVYENAFKLDGKTKARKTPAGDRGDERRKRKTLRRKGQRLAALVSRLDDIGCWDASLLADRDGWIWKLRRRAVEGPVTAVEFGRCLHHIAQRRQYADVGDLLKSSIPGYKVLVSSQVVESPLPEENGGASDAEQEERGLVMRAHNNLLADMKEAGAKTVGVFFAMKYDRGEAVRNKGGASWKNPGYRILRAQLEEEFDLIWDQQEQYLPVLQSRALRDEVREIIFGQRLPAKNPAARGTCTFHPSHPRTSKATLVFQRFRMLSDLNSLRVTESQSQQERALTDVERAVIFELMESQATVAWSVVKSAIGLTPDAQFNREWREIPRSSKPNSKPKAKGAKHLSGNQVSAALRSAMGVAWDAMSAGRTGEERMFALIAGDASTHATQDRFALDLANALTPRDRYKVARRFGLDEQTSTRVAMLSMPDGYANLCTKALKRIEPHLASGLVYSRACLAAGYNHVAPKSHGVAERLDPSMVPDMRNPVVQRSVAMAFKVVNDYIALFGKPAYINIELSREVAKSKEERAKETDANLRKAERNDEAAQLLKEHKKPVTNKNILLVKLWEEAGRRLLDQFDGPEVCIDDLVDSGTKEHVWHLSQCYDNSWLNLTVTSHAFNTQVKGTKTFYEIFKSDPSKWEHFQRYVEALPTMSAAKKRRLLAEFVPPDTGFVGQQLSMGGYIAKAVKDHIEAQIGVPVRVSKGRITAALREILMFPEKDRDWHCHHAEDAFLIAITNPSLLQHLTKKMQGVTMRHTTRPSRPVVWEGFDLTVVDGLVQSVGGVAIEVFVQPSRSVGGQYHDGKARAIVNRRQHDGHPFETTVETVTYLPCDRKERREGEKKGNPKTTRCLVKRDSRGRATHAYPTGSNSALIVWSRRSGGKVEYVVEVLSTAEAARGLRCKRSTKDRRAAGYREVLRLAKNDMVEVRGLGLYRVVSFSEFNSGETKLDLSKVSFAGDVAKAKAPVHLQRTSRAGKRPQWLDEIEARVVYSPAGRLTERFVPRQVI